MDAATNLETLFPLHDRLNKKIHCIHLLFLTEYLLKFPWTSVVSMQWAHLLQNVRTANELCRYIHFRPWHSSLAKRLWRCSRRSGSWWCIFINMQIFVLSLAFSFSFTSFYPMEFCFWNARHNVKQKQTNEVTSLHLFFGVQWRFSESISMF